jgi:hypothetical protein
MFSFNYLLIFYKLNLQLFCNYELSSTHVIIAFCLYCVPFILVSNNIWLLFWFHFNYLLELILNYCVDQHTCRMLTYTSHVVNPWTPCGNKQFVTHLNFFYFVVTTLVACMRWFNFQWKNDIPTYWLGFYTKRKLCIFN